MSLDCTVYGVGAAADEDEVGGPDELEDAEGVGSQSTASWVSSGCMAGSMSVACSLRTRRSLTSFGIVLLWSLRDRSDMFESPGVRKGDVSSMLAGSGVAVDVFSLGGVVDVDGDGDGEGVLSVTAGMVIVVLMVIVLEVVVESHVLPLDVVVALVT